MSFSIIKLPCMICITFSKNHTKQIWGTEIAQLYCTNVNVIMVNGISKMHIWVITLPHARLLFILINWSLFWFTINWENDEMSKLIFQVTRREDCMKYTMKILCVGRWMIVLCIRIITFWNFTIINCGLSCFSFWSILFRYCRLVCIFKFYI